MTKKTTFADFRLRPGTCIKIGGYILADAKSFIIELGKDPGNVGLHFNPRFNFRNEKKVIVCNSRNDYDWGREEKQHHFVFEQGTKTEISITFELKQYKIKFSDGFEFTFPNHLNFQEINFLEIRQDFKLQTLRFL